MRRGSACFGGHGQKQVLVAQKLNSMFMRSPSPKKLASPWRSTLASASIIASPRRQDRKRRKSVRYSYCSGPIGLLALVLDEEGRRVDAKAGDAQLQPEAHDPLDLLAHGRIRDIQVGLELVEAMEVVGCARLSRSRSSSERRETRCRWRRPSACVWTRRTNRDMASSGSERADLNHGC